MICVPTKSKVQLEVLDLTSGDRQYQTLAIDLIEPQSLTYTATCISSKYSGFPEPFPVVSPKALELLLLNPKPATT